MVGFLSDIDKLAIAVTDNTAGVFKASVKIRERVLAKLTEYEKAGQRNGWSTTEFEKW